MPSIGLGSALKPSSRSREPEIVSGDGRQGFLERYRNAVSRRAYDIFERHGHNHGNDVSHWLQAEQELALTLPEVRESAGTYSVELALPGVSAEQVKVCAHEDRAVVAAESTTNRKESGEDATETVSTYYMVRWPEETDPDTTRAQLDSGRLTLTTRKANAGQTTSKASTFSSASNTSEQPRIAPPQIARETRAETPADEKESRTRTFLRTSH
jgi:HSP20 family molecular chaperone IbpA